MTTKVTLEIPVARVKVHPKNPRRDAVADDELVASVAESGITTPLLVAVDLSKQTAADVLAHATGQRSLLTGAPYVVALDGHRRRDAAKKAKLRTVPVVIDLGLASDVDQLRAMLLANTLREGLSPVEVAEAYQGMLDLGLKQVDVAKATGRRPRDVSAQLKVLKLAGTTLTKVHAGVLTLDDAAGLVEFAGDPDVTKKLEAAAESGTDFRYQLQRARQERDREREVAAQVAELEQAGITGETYKEWTSHPYGTVPPIAWNRTVTEDQHRELGCLSYVRSGGENGGHAPDVTLVCTNKAQHEAAAAVENDEAAQERQSQAEVQRREAEERQVARAAAEKVRYDVVRGLAGQDLKISPAFEHLLRGLLPALWFALENEGPMDTYEQLADVPEATGVSRLPWGVARDTASVDHIALFAEIPKASLGRHLVAALAAYGEWAFSGVYEGEAVTRAVAAPYADLLAAAGYEFAGPDADLKAALDHPAHDDQDEAGPDDVEGASS